MIWLKLSICRRVFVLSIFGPGLPKIIIITGIIWLWWIIRIIWLRITGSTVAVLSLTRPLLHILGVMGDPTLRSSTCPRPDHLAQSTLRTTGSKAAPGSPLGGEATKQGEARLGSLASSSWPLTAVVLLVKVEAKLLAVVGATNQPRLAASVTIILSSISRSITVSFPLIAGILRSAASSAVVVSARTSLT